MKNWLLLSLFLLSVLAVNGQNQFANEWIRPSQKYLKFSTTKTGIYRVKYGDIQAADASFLQTNPTTWQLYFRGKEMAIRVVGEKDGVFDAQDYVEFYGEGNDGSQDSLLYRPQQRLHPYQTLFSDTTAYFLTSAPATVGKRMAELNNSVQGLTAEKFHVEESLQAFTSSYTFNNLVQIEPFLQQSYFEPGEGWSGPIMTLDSTGLVQFKLTGRVNTDWPITMNGMLNGRDNTYHQVQMTLNGATTPLSTITLIGFESRTFSNTLTASDLPNEQLALRFKAIKNATTNNFSITYVKLSYPQALDMSGLTTKVFHVVPNTTQSALLSIQNAPASAFAYDITDKANCRLLAAPVVNGQAQVVSAADRYRTIYMTNQTIQPVSVKAVRFSSTFPKATDYLIITHATLRSSVNTYAAYRASDQGGHYTPFIVEADSLYDQFNYGERSPLALRRFADYMRVNSAVKYLLLAGRANSYPYTVKTATNNWVPTIGYPGSDILLTAGLGNFSINTPAIPTGRLNVVSNDQVLTYLEKVKQMESPTANGIWRKHIIHISGGKTPTEAQSLRTAMQGFASTFQNGVLGGQVSAFSKSQFVAEVENINIVPLVNDGVSLITFFGHAGPTVTDMNFGYASPVQNGFNNVGQYPLMVFNGCGAGEIFSKYNTLSTDWLLAPQKGAGIVLAHSYYSYEQSTEWYLSRLYSTLYNSTTTLGMPIGLVQQQLNQVLDKEKSDTYQEAMILEMVLQGDPAVSLYPLPNPDFTFGKQGIYLQSNVAGGSLKNSDSLRIVLPLANLGKYVAGQSVTVSLKKTNSAGPSSTSMRFTSFRYQDTLVYTIPKDATLQKIEIVIDPDKQITELDKNNNTATLTIDWSQIQGSSYPSNILPDKVAPAVNVFVNGVIRENQAVVNTTPHIDIYLLDQNSLSAKDTSAISVYLKTCDTCTPQKVPSSALSVTAVSENQLLVTTNLSLQAGNTYQLIVFGKDAAGNQTQPPYQLDLTVTGSEERITFQATPNPATSFANFELMLNTPELPTDSRLTIYSLTGALLYDAPFPLNPGKNSFLWQGVTAPGLYVYSLKLTWQGGRTETYKGRVIWQK